jgi:hypothetical protein
MTAHADLMRHFLPRDHGEARYYAAVEWQSSQKLGLTMMGELSTSQSLDMEGCLPLACQRGIVSRISCSIRYVYISVVVVLDLQSDVHTRELALVVPLLGIDARSKTRPLTARPRRFGFFQ